MSGSSLAVRVVLSCCLTFNGLGTGLLAHAQIGHTTDVAAAPATSEPAAVAAKDAESPCHGSPATPAPGSPQPSTDRTETEGRGKDTPPACCLLVACGGACLQHAPAVVSFWIPPVVITRTTDDVLIRAAHASPDLPQ